MTRVHFALGHQREESAVGDDLTQVYGVDFYLPLRFGERCFTDAVRTHVASTFDRAVQYCLDNLVDLDHDDPNADEPMFYSICCDVVDDRGMNSGAQVGIVRRSGDVEDFRDVMREKGYAA